MEDFEKKDNMLPENGETSNETEKIKKEEETNADSSLALNETPTALPSVQKTVYRWSYNEDVEAEEKKRKKTASRGAVIYSVVISVAFLLCFAFLVFTLLYDFAFVPKAPESTELPQNVVRVEERIVYVREHDSESGVLTTQEIYDKCLPSTVSIVVSDGTNSGSGSGFFITTDGYIATANHVIDGMTSITVITSSGEMFDAKVIGGNDYTDLAVIKIEKNDCTAMKIGSSDKLLVGDTVVAIGTPASIDFSGSLTKGTVSYTDRLFKVYNSSGTAVEKKMHLIQTDTLVNPGNSGCALINEYGEMVGIVTRRLTITYFDGICFAIPSDGAMPILEAMMNGENYDSLLSAVSVKPAVLGITGSNVEIPSAGISGIKIDSFLSPSYDASTKLKSGDVITHMDGIEVRSISELRLVIDRKVPGDTAEITFYRDGQSMTVYVVLGS